jgi:hypothetical protein
MAILARSSLERNLGYSNGNVAVNVGHQINSPNKYQRDVSISKLCSIRIHLSVNQSMGAKGTSNRPLKQHLFPPFVSVEELRWILGLCSLFA